MRYSNHQTKFTHSPIEKFSIKDCQKFIVILCLTKQEIFMWDDNAKSTRNRKRSRNHGFF